PALAAVPGGEEPVVRADLRVLLDDAAGFRQNRRFLFLTSRVLFGQLPREIARPGLDVAVPPAHQQEIEREVRRSHPASGVEARRQDEADVKAGTHAAGEPALF